MSKTVVGLFAHSKDAQKAVRDLNDAKIGNGGVKVMTSDERHQVLDGLTGKGIPQEDAHVYAEGVRRGGALVVADTENNQADRAVAILDRNNILDMEQLGARYRKDGFQGFDAAQPPYKEPNLSQERQVNRDVTIPIVEEKLEVGKRQVERVGARVHTFVTERPVEAQVTLRDEAVTVNRRPVDRAVTDADAAFKTSDMEVTETDEVAVVSKTARVVEEVVVGKTATDRTETVKDTVRRTDVEVQDLDGNASNH